MKHKTKAFHHMGQIILRLIPILAAILLIIYAVLSYRNDTVTLSVNERVDEMTTKASINAKSIQERYRVRLNTLEVLAENCVEDPRHVDYNLQIIAKMGLFDYVGILNEEGIGFDNEQRSITANERNYFQEAIRGKAVVTDVLDSPVYKNDQVQIMAVPVKDGGAITGVVYGTMNAASIERSLHSISNDFIHTYIVDSNGVPLTPLKSKDWLLGATTMWDYFDSIDFEFCNGEKIRDDIKHGRSGYYAVKVNGEKRVTYYTPLNINQCYLFTNLEVKDLEKDFDKLYERSTAQLVQLGVAFAIILFTLIKYAVDYMRRLELDYHNALSTHEILEKVSAENKFYIFEYHLKTGKVLKRAGRDFDLFKNNQFNFDYLYKDEDVVALKEALDKIKDTPQVSVDVAVRMPTEIRYMQIQFKNIYDKNQECINTIGYIKDITDLKVQEQLALRILKEKENFRHKAEVDGLTGLYNAAAAYEKIDKRLACGINKYQMICLMDLDNFKCVNDTLGHSMGNRVLTDIAQVLKRHFSEEDLLARIGGDEFLIYFETDDLTTLDTRFKHLVKECVNSYQEGDHQVEVSASFGIAYKPKDGDNLEILFKKADAALYEVKRQSKCGYRLYDGREEA